MSTTTTTTTMMKPYERDLCANYLNEDVDPFDRAVDSVWKQKFDQSWAKRSRRYRSTYDPNIVYLETRRKTVTALLKTLGLDVSDQEDLRAYRFMLSMNMCQPVITHSSFTPPEKPKLKPVDEQMLSEGRCFLCEKTMDNCCCLTSSRE
jgi:hypothetical protein